MASAIAGGIAVLVAVGMGIAWYLNKYRLGSVQGRVEHTDHIMPGYPTYDQRLQELGRPLLMHGEDE